MASLDMDQELTSVVKDADSPSWSVRAAAGRRLAASPELADVSEVLHRLLLDTQDAGVTQETARALLERADTPGLRAVLAALACAASAGTADQLGGELDWNPHWMTKDGTNRLTQQLRQLAADDDAGVRSEAEQILKSLR
ncbi:hypothetical protein [Streptomyces brevispora]|uniref:hypothetical protein n=1 Tax=Streptomyces brevispora TaxID=887462 RepID=UPI003803BBB7